MASNVRNSIIFIIIVILFLFWARSCQQGSNPVADITESAENAIEKTTDVVTDISDSATDVIKDVGTSVSDSAGALLEKLGEFFSVTLPNGIELSIPEFGVENKLIGFISGDAEIDKNKWFEFDRINFATGSTGLSEDSQEQISNIASILDAYPNVSMKIGGYTDNTGSHAVNMRLSQARADSVKRALVKQGIDGSRLTTEGYGPAHPAASNDTEEGRAQNRRIALRVTAK